MSRLIVRDNVVLVIIDVQDKLLNVVQSKDEVINNILKLVKVCKILNIPIIITEQYPKGLGRTNQKLIETLSNDYAPIEKTTFSCFKVKEFEERLLKLGRKTLILTGLETHICVLQTALEAIDKGYRVLVCVDAISSRRREDHTYALERMKIHGIELTTVETIIYELIEDAVKPEFKEVLKIVKE